MGEGKGGEGSGRRPRADQLLRQLVDEYSKHGIRVGEVRAQRITEGVYAIEIHEHGVHTPERFILSA